PLTIFVHKFYCWSGWTRLYHNLRLGSNVCTLLYYCQSDKTGLLRLGVSFQIKHLCKGIDPNQKKLD
ncbi:MAG: hypothetical protein KME05_18780, partial [Gloeocapsa sp. UFS-A4-WI-NPMV-4B04]|nr:hypothetical protein [Gloeocapsa sp. UFS-A4-WI-NPMV-4B04]